MRMLVPLLLLVLIISACNKVNVETAKVLGSQALACTYSGNWNIVDNFNEGAGVGDDWGGGL